MQTITRYLAIILMALITLNVAAQDKPSSSNAYKIQALKEEREAIKLEERELLKAAVEKINEQQDRGEISLEEANRLKKELARKHALNIENRIAIIDNQIAFLERNERDIFRDDDDQIMLRVGRGIWNDELIFFGNRKDDKPIKRDRRTTSQMVLAFGLNNTIIEGQSLDDSPYKIGGSRFFEIGWAWRTRVFNQSNFMRFKYGFSFQINGLKPTDNRYFVDEGMETILEPFEYELDKSKLTVSNLVFPVHFEFGPSKKYEREDYFRYSTRNQFKIGIGGYAGSNIGARQKLKYSADGNKIKDKIKRDYNTTNLVYGLSGYLAFDDTALYIKYDLSPLFKDQAVEQRNISLGLRIDLD